MNLVREHFPPFFDVESVLGVRMCVCVCLQ